MGPEEAIRMTKVLENLSYGDRQESYVLLVEEKAPKWPQCSLPILQRAYRKAGRLFIREHRDRTRGKGFNLAKHKLR